MKTKKLTRCISYRKASLVSVTPLSLVASLANHTRWQRLKGISNWSATITLSIRGKVSLFIRRWTTPKASPSNEITYTIRYLRSSRTSSYRSARKHLIITSIGSTNLLLLKDVKNLKRLIRLDSFSINSTLTIQHRSVRRYRPCRNTETSQCSNSSYVYKNEMNSWIENRNRIRLLLNPGPASKLKRSNNNRKKIRYQRP